MLALQESETVAFDPASLHGNPAWYEKLFVLYLLFMLLVLAARGAQLLWNLAQLRRQTMPGPFHALAQAAHVRAESLRRFSVLTFVLTLADFCLAAANMLTQLGTQKVSGTLWLSLDAAQQLHTSAFGLLLCAALYTAGFFFQSRIARRQLSFEKESREAQTRASQQNN